MPRKSSKKCYACENPLYKENGPSERYWFFDYKLIAPAGVCCNCKRGFCYDHYGFYESFDPEVSTYGQASWCSQCLDEIESEYESEYASRIDRAKAWKNWYGPVGNFIAYCIQGSKPKYFGTRSHSSK
jgi:hypothetical protein